MGIILCKELGKQYEEETFEYFKLSEILVSLIYHSNIRKLIKYA